VCVQFCSRASAGSGFEKQALLRSSSPSAALPSWRLGLLLQSKEVCGTPGEVEPEIHWAVLGGWRAWAGQCEATAFTTFEAVLCSRGQSEAIRSPAVAKIVARREADGGEGAAPGAEQTAVKLTGNDSKAAESSADDFAVKLGATTEAIAGALPVGECRSPRPRRHAPRPRRYQD